MTELELQAIEARRQCCLGTGRARDTEASLADIPALCAEVRRLRAYLESRFGEAAPTYPCMFNFCPTPDKCRIECQSQNKLRPEHPPTPSAPATCGVGNDNRRDGATACTKPAGHLGNHRDERNGSQWPPDRLARLERFCEAYAKWQTHRFSTEEMRRASRDFLEGK